MLGLIHRAALRKGPAQLQMLFRRTSTAHRQIEEWNMRGGAGVLKRSAFGLIPVYNKLPEAVRNVDAVKAFQHALQSRVKQALLEGGDGWRALLSPRHRRIVPYRPFCEPECCDFPNGKHHPKCSQFSLQRGS